jgi:K+ transporter
MVHGNGRGGKWRCLRFHFSLGRYFCGINFAQDLAGGWVPIVIGIVVFTILMTWKRGREIVYHRLETDALPMSLFIQSIGSSNETHFVPGEAIFLTGNRILCHMRCYIISSTIKCYMSVMSW